MLVVLATKNAKKRRELAAILAEAAPACELAPAELDWPDVEETGTTFAANAELKARAVAAATGLVAVADDSGLEVDALGGEPGVMSARYAGGHGDDAANNALVLERLVHVPDPAQRRGRFRCAVAVATPEGECSVVEGAVEGTIRPGLAGTGGFGYDPMFEPLGWDRTFAEATPEEKAAISHRGVALRAAVEVLAALAEARA